MGRWEKAVRLTPKTNYQALRDQLEAIGGCYSRIGALLQKQAKAAPDGMERELTDFKKAQTLIGDYVALIESAVATSAPATEHGPEAPAASAGKDTEVDVPSVHPNALAIPGCVQDSLNASLEAARRNWPQGLRRVAKDAAGEMSGRDLYFLKLDVARLFIDKQRHDLAGVLLEGLNKEVTDRGLLQWEGRSFVAEVKALLCRCRTREGKPDDAMKLQEELCHLAPWLAVDA
jgi:hypothetical protein